MLSMRICAGLVLSAVLCSGVGAAQARAEVYCADAFPKTAIQRVCTGPPSSIQDALDRASAHPGPDTVGLNSGYYNDTPNLFYSDRGQADNGVTITAMPRCGRYGCELVQVDGGATSGSLLSFGGGGGADVTVSGFYLFAEHGAVGLTLPPGGHATSVSVGAADGGVAVRLEGSAARPATVSGGSVGARQRGDARGIGVDVTGHGVLEHVWMSGDIGVQVHPGGSVDVFAGVLQSTVGVTGARARVVGTVVNQTYQGDRTLGERAIAFEAACAGPEAPDAELSVTNATVIGGGRTDTTGARAVGRGGDGSGCDATVRMSSTILSRVATPLDASGEAGSGAAPEDGRARVEAAYSNFDAETVSSSGPAEIETSKPGRNLDTSSGFEDAQLEGSTGPEALLWFVGLRRDSPMIDRGDPAPPEPWQEPWIPVVNRRDIGAFEYGRNLPRVYISTSVYGPVPPRRLVTLRAVPDFFDAVEPPVPRWTLSDGTTAFGSDVARRYPRPGRYTERVVVTDSEGRTADNQVTVTVVRQRIRELSLSTDRFRATPRPDRPSRVRGTKVYVDVAAFDDVAFRVERAVRSKRTGKRVWRRLPVGFEAEIYPIGPVSVFFSGWLEGERLRPGSYRLVAAAHGARRRPARVRFTIIR
jgi:PKD domain